MIKLIDLTQTVTEASPTWSGQCGFSKKIVHDYETDDARVTTFDCVSGIGTHMDLPAHFIQGGACAHDFDIKHCMAPLYIIQAPYQSLDESLVVDEQHFDRLYQTHGERLRGAFVAINTGWDRKWSNPSEYRHVRNGKMHFPTLSIALAQRLIDMSCVGIGMDTLSPDREDSGFPVHHAVLSEGMFIVENLTNLNQVPSSGAQMCAMPLKMTGLTESPTRAFAMVNEAPS